MQEELQLQIRGGMLYLLGLMARHVVDYHRLSSTPSSLNSTPTSAPRDLALTLLSIERVLSSLPMKNFTQDAFFPLRVP